MNARKAEKLRLEAKRAAEMHPELNRRYIYQMAKKDYLATPRKQRPAFSMFEQV